MKLLTTTFLMAALGAGMAFAQAPPAPKPPAPKAPAASSGNSADEIKKVENDWMAAAKAKDAVKLGEILADDWVGLEWNGKTHNKAKELADLKTAGNSLDSFEIGPMNIRFFGDTAVVTGSNTEKSTANGKDTGGKYIWTDVLVKQSGKWRVVSSQSTKASQ